MSSQVTGSVKSVTPALCSLRVGEPAMAENMWPA
jgi:hypothetical protein